MRHLKVYIGLFLLFVGFMSATRHLDAYTVQYAKCAEKWDTSVNLASDQPYLSEKLLENLEGNLMTVQGEKCPALREDHKVIVKIRLESQPKPVLRGLSRS